MGIDVIFTASISILGCHYKMFRRVLRNSPSHRIVQSQMGEVKRNDSRS
jgi:hypothetical protein